MKMLPHDQFVVRMDGSPRNIRFLPMSTGIVKKVFHGSCGNLSSPCKGSINHKYPETLDNVGEHSSANTGEPSEVEKSTFLFLWSH